MENIYSYSPSTQIQQVPQIIYQDQNINPISGYVYQPQMYYSPSHSVYEQDSSDIVTTSSSEYDLNGIRKISSPPVVKPLTWDVFLNIYFFSK